MDVVMSPGEAYFYDGYTHPDRRSRGVDGAVRAFIFNTMRRAGCRRVYSYVSGNNPPALREPPAKRSTGYHALPEPYFVSAATTSARFSILIPTRTFSRM